jgi:aminopeptidase N
MEQFVVQTMQETMQFDSLANTNPMTSLVITPSDIMANYNYVAYPKGILIIIVWIDLIQ